MTKALRLFAATCIAFTCGQRAGCQSSEIVVASEFASLSPARFEAAFLATNVGTMLASEEGAGLGSKLGRLALSGIDRATRAQMAGWEGSIHGQVLTWRSRDPWETVETTLLLELNPIDQSTTPNQLARRLGWNPEDDTLATLPAMGDGDQAGAPLRVALGLPPEGPARTEALRQMESFEPLVSSAPAKVVVHIDTLLADERAHEGDWVDLADALGAGSLTTLEITLAPAGPHVQLELALESNGAPRGIFGGLFPAVSGLPSGIRMPSDPETLFKVGHIDLQQVALAIGNAIQFRPIERCRPPGEVLERHFDFDIMGELLDHLGHQGVAVAASTPLNRTNELGNTGFLVNLKDGVAFATGWAQHKEAFFQGLFLTLDNEQELPRGTLYSSGSQVGVVVTPGQFGIAFGPDGLDQLKTLVDEPAVGDTTAAPAALVGPRRHAAPGLNGFGSAPAGLALTHWVDPLVFAIQEFTGFKVAPTPLLTRQETEQLAPLLLRHHLSHIASFTSYEKARWTLRLLW